jgi:hypothetical protein
VIDTTGCMGSPGTSSWETRIWNLRLSLRLLVRAAHDECCRGTDLVVHSRQKHLENHGGPLGGTRQGLWLAQSPPTANLRVQRAVHHCTTEGFALTETMEHFNRKRSYGGHQELPGLLFVARDVAVE